MTRQCTDALNDIIWGMFNKTLVERPCKIVSVNSPYSVDIEYINKDNTYDVLYNVPVKHIQTQKAYVFLGLNPGDRGTIRFLDIDSSLYRRGAENLDTDNRTHNINDGMFIIGYFPESEQYMFPSGDIVIGTTTGAIISIVSDGITITGGNIAITGGSVSLSGNTVIDGKKFLEHCHSNGNNGANTGSVV